MFYAQKVDRALRVGDVLTGYVIVAPRIRRPFLGAEDHDYTISIELPQYCVVLSPCCSIGEKKISLSPLLKVRRTFFDNPYFDDDLTRLNRRMDSKDVLPPEKWVLKSGEEKARILKEDLVYAFVDLFVYEQNELFSGYPVRRHGQTESVRYYMIDFRNIYKVDCENIVSASQAPLESKVLQLSAQVRSELRAKLSYYYGRPPKEDMAPEH